MGEEHARSHGFHMVCVEPANQATRHIWENKLDYTVVASIVLADFTDADGTKPFRGCERTEEMAACVKDVQEHGTKSPCCLLVCLVPCLLVAVPLLSLLPKRCTPKPLYAYSLVA